MAGRVLLNSQGLRVSPPGVDVSSALPGQLLFSSDWSALALYTQGDHPITWSTQGEVGWHTAFIPFGKTFASPPVVWFYKTEADHVVPIGSTYGFTVHLTDTSLSNQPRDFYVYAEVLTNGIDIRAFYNKRTSGWPTPQFTVRYYVFEYNL